MQIPAEKDGTPPTLLVVDDNDTLLQLLDLLLSHHGANVVLARSGEECLAIARRRQIDLVILDVMMPGMDGIQVSAELKRSSPLLPIILLTAKGDLKTRAAAMALGVNEFITKPVYNHELLKRVRTHIGARQCEKELDRGAAAVARLSDSDEKSHQPVANPPRNG
jgi:DNA-binding response OmpR family regulator